MSRPTLVTLLLLLTCTFIGCKSKPTHESLMKEQVECMEELVATLKGVKDEPSATAAKISVQKLVQRMDTIKIQGKSLGDLPTDKQQELLRQYLDRLSKAGGDLVGEMVRIEADPKMKAALGELPSARSTP